MLLKTVILALIFGAIITGYSCIPANYSKSDIVKITDFELSPDEEKIAFSAITPIGNLDIWVVDIDGKNLKKLTFQDHSPTNHIAKFFKRHRWRNYYKIDMYCSGWTKDGRIAFSQELTSHNIWGIRTVNLLYWTISPDGTDKKSKTDSDKIIEMRPFDPINRAEPYIASSQKQHKKIFMDKDTLWILKDGETTPERLVQ